MYIVLKTKQGKRGCPLYIIRYNIQNEDDKFFNALFEPNEHEQRLYDMAEREKKAREARQTNQTIQVEDFLTSSLFCATI